MAILMPDVSHWQGPHTAGDFRKAKKHVKALLFKASEGTGYDDDTFRQNVASAEKVGLPWGAYIFTDSGPGAPQATNFIRDLRGKTPSFVMVDWEAGDHETAKVVTQDLQHHYRVPVLTYLGAWARAHGGELGMEDGAMVPQYGPASLSGAYKPRKVPLVAWQYTDGKFNGTRMPKSIPGIGPCDISEVFIPRLVGISSHNPPPKPKPKPKVTRYTAGGDDKEYRTATGAFLANKNRLKAAGDKVCVTRKEVPKP